MLLLMLHMRRTAMVHAAIAVLRCSACAAWRARSGRARRREAEAEAAAEPVLSSFLHAAVVAQPSLTAAVAWVLAHRLDDCSSSGLDPVRPRGAGVGAGAAAYCATRTATRALLGRGAAARAWPGCNVWRGPLKRSIGGAARMRRCPCVHRAG